MKCTIINNGELFETLRKKFALDSKQLHATDKDWKTKGLRHSQATLAQNLPVLHNALKL